MKTIYIKSVAICTVLLVVACSGPKAVISSPDSALLDIAKKRYPSATLASLNAGHTIYTTKCNQCHDLKPIVGRSEESWVHEIKDMAPKAKLTAEETETLSQYLLSARQLK